MKLLTQAVTAYLSALEVFTREEIPQVWALLQSNLGIALRERGVRTIGSGGMELLAQAVAACSPWRLICARNSICARNRRINGQCFTTI